ncbi:hypothetical protein BDN71DRAFT_1512209 [Pleurotus eryngii]|uniref:Uncharacterized protein n=1 Tax=Pleurotus eryngii TaxID=5323 RepID=A0A9P5ZKV1_PLEER|nr:hypothetical protein BDN71DRAFT_1512209 [Pleurotus eryngii]
MEFGLATQLTLYASTPYDSLRVVDPHLCSAPSQSHDDAELTRNPWVIGRNSLRLSIPAHGSTSLVYLGAIGSLFDILLALRKLHETPSVLAQQQQIKGFIPIVVCVDKAVATTLQYDKLLKQLHMEFLEFDLHFSDLMESGDPPGIFLRVFATHRWPSLSRRIQLLIEQNQVLPERRLQFPKSRQIVGDTHGELGHLLPHSGISSETRIRHLEVQTI